MRDYSERVSARKRDEPDRDMPNKSNNKHNKSDNGSCDIPGEDKADHPLFEDERMFRSLFMTNAQGICLHELVFDRSGKAVDYRIIDANPAFESITGFSRKKAIGAIASRLYKTRDTPYFDVYRKVALTGKPHSFDSYFKPMNKHFLISVFSPRKNQFVTVFSDITAMKKAESDLQESQARYKSLLDQSFDFILVISSIGRILYANRMALSTIGYSEKEVVGKSISFFLTKNSLKKASYSLAQEFLGHPQPRMELEIISKSGDIHILEMNSGSSFVFENGERTGILVNAHDVTERKKADETLKEKYDAFKKLSSQVPGMIYQFVRRPDGKYCVPFTTDAIKSIFGCSPADVRRDFSPIAKVILPEDRDRVITSIERSAKDLTPWQCEYRVKLPGKPVQWLFGQSMPEKMSDGSVMWNGFNTDITERKKAAEALIESEERYRSLVENASDQIFMVDKECRMISLNNAALVKFGKRRSAVIGKHISHLFPRKTAVRNLKNIRKVFKTGKSMSVEEELSFGGDNIFVSSSLNPIKNDAGETIKVFGVVRDITEARKTAKDLAEKERFISSIMENLPNMVFVKDAKDLKFELLNRVGEELLGYKREDLIGKSDSDFFPKKQADSFILKDREVLRLGKLVDIPEEEISTKKGTRILHTKKIPVMDSQARPQYLLGISEDITESKKVEKALIESENRLDEAQRMARLGNWVWDIKTGRVKWSEEVFKIFGLNPKKFTPQIDSIMALSPWPEDHARDKELIRRATKSHEIGSYEQRFLRPDKSVGYYYSSFQGKYDARGKLITIIGTVQDITERKKAEESLKQGQQELLESEERNRGFVNSTSDMAFLKDEAFRYLMVNEANQKFFGKPESEILGKTDFDLMPIEMAKNCLVSDKAAIAKNGVNVVNEIVNGKVYESRKFPVRLKNNRMGVGGFIRDITEQETARIFLNRRVDFDNIASSISSDFLSSSFAGFDAVMTSALQKLAEFLGYDRGYVFQFREDGKTADNTHEWCAKGIASHINNLKGMMIPDELPWFAERISSKESFYVPDVSQLPAMALKEKKHFDKQSIRSLVVLPLWTGDVIIGFFGFDSVKERKSFSDEDIRIMKVIESVLSNVIIKHRSEAQLLASEKAYRMQARETDILNRVILVGNQSSDLMSLLKSLMDEILSLLSFSGGGVYLREPGDFIAKLNYSKDLPAGFIKAIGEIDIRKAPFSIVFLKKEAVFADDYAKYQPYLAKKFDLMSVASIPILSADEVVGAVNITTKKRHEFSVSEKRLLNAIGRAMGVSIVNMLAEENLRLRTSELEKINRMVVGRELKMVELKKRIAGLEQSLGKDSKTMLEENGNEENSDIQDG